MKGINEIGFCIAVIGAYFDVNALVKYNYALKQKLGGQYNLRGR